MYGDKGFSQKAAPVKVGEELEVTIEAVGKKGDGIAKIEGFVLFINGVRKGDLVKVKVTKVLRNVGFAEVVGKAKERAESDPDGEDSESEEDEESEESEEKDSEDIEDTENFGEEEK